MANSNRILVFFRNLRRRNADRKEYIGGFREHLDRQAYALHLPAAVVCALAWLGFAFITDKQLHPKFPELIYFRLAFTALSVLMLIVIALDALFKRFGGETLQRLSLRGKGFGWLYALTFYAVAATSFFTGRIAHDANYVSGLQLILLVITVVPTRLRFLYIMYLVSILLFVTSVIVYKPDLSTPSAEYSMQNLVIAYVIGFILGFMLDRFRFNGFVSHQKVTEQGREVEARMEQIRALKIQQDGDYFLTARLLEPLIRNDIHGETLRADFLLNQKKKFTFRKWTSEIGGDFLAAHTVKLRGREFTAFVNGDAMGKSIQGAGGALVLGTVFKSVISRTVSRVALFDKYPEMWLKDCFVELQNTFVSFDGTMMISAVLGLIDNATGVMYYINAEHPWVVLYREGRATFIENELALRKIGIQNLEGHMRVEIFSMLPGDVMIIGSDGRDDVVVGTDAEGMRVINEDEEKFLSHVEQGRGSLEGVEKSILSGATLADDLSLLRLAYREGEQLPAEDEPDVRALAGEHARAGRYEEAAKYCEMHTDRYPADTDFIFLCSRLFKKAYIAERKVAHLEKAADFGERCRLRDGSRSENLINLADVYRLLGNRERALMILELARSADPGNHRLEKLRKLLK